MKTAAEMMSSYQIRREGWAALTERLGVSGAMRFLMQYDPGQDDYTRERNRILKGLRWSDVTGRLREVEDPAKLARRRKARRGR